MIKCCNRSCIWPALLVVLLVGCQTTPPKHGLSGPEQMRILPTIETWEAEGKLSLQAANNRQNGFFTWSQNQQDYNIHLFGPFGAGATWLRRTAQGITLENAKLGTHHARSAEDLMRSVLGWQVPVDGLQYWLRGIPAPSSKAHALQLDEEGFVQSFLQDGWQISYRDRQWVENWYLPRRIVAERADVRVIAITNRWNLAPAPALGPATKP